jgi:hypothetical protein
MQSLLTHPLSSATQFPAFFPRLPKGVKRMPRMGGWEEEPPAPNDPRLGRENLTKDYVPAQKPFEMIVTLSPGAVTASSLGAHAGDWVKSHAPLLSSSATKDTFMTHSVSINAGSKAASPIKLENTFFCRSGEDVMDSHWSHMLAEWMTLAVESCQGDASARKSLANLDVVAAKL